MFRDVGVDVPGEVGVEVTIVPAWVGVPVVFIVPA